MEILGRPLSFRIGQAVAAVALAGALFDAGIVFTQGLEVFGDDIKIKQLDQQYAANPFDPYYQGMRNASSDDRDILRTSLEDTVVVGTVGTVAALGVGVWFMLTSRDKQVVGRRTEGAPQSPGTPTTPDDLAWMPVQDGPASPQS